MMTSRENTLATLHGEKADYVPLSTKEVALHGFLPYNLEMPLQPGPDGFGVPWVATKEGTTPDPHRFIFEDIKDWEKYVKIPDLDQINFHEMAAMEKQMFPEPDQTQIVTEFVDGGGLFLRMVSFMGFENTLVALVEEPESCTNFFEALTEYKLKFIDKFCEAYHPDIYCFGDDIATERALFMSPETWRKLFKPFDARIFEKIRSHGMIAERHNCGKCEAVMADFVEIGVQMWQSAQPMNDLAGILDTYRGKLGMEGGWDTSGPVSRIGATKEEVRAEVRRCLTEYKKPGFMLWPSLLNERGNSVLVGDDRLEDLVDEWEKHKYF